MNLTTSPWGRDPSHYNYPCCVNTFSATRGFANDADSVIAIRGAERESGKTTSASAYNVVLKAIIWTESSTSLRSRRGDGIAQNMRFAFSCRFLYTPRNNITGRLLVRVQIVGCSFPTCDNGRLRSACPLPPHSLTGISHPLPSAH